MQIIRYKHPSFKRCWESQLSVLNNTGIDSNSGVLTPQNAHGISYPFLVHIHVHVHVCAISMPLSSSASMSVSASQSRWAVVRETGPQGASQWPALRTRQLSCPRCPARKRAGRPETPSTRRVPSKAAILEGIARRSARPNLFCCCD